MREYHQGKDLTQHQGHCITRPNPCHYLLRQTNAIQIQRQTTPLDQSYQPHASSYGTGTLTARDHAAETMRYIISRRPPSTTGQQAARHRAARTIERSDAAFLIGELANQGYILILWDEIPPRQVIKILTLLYWIFLKSKRVCEIVLSYSFLFFSFLLCITTGSSLITTCRKGITTVKNRITTKLPCIMSSIYHKIVFETLDYNYRVYPRNYSKERDCLV